MENILSILIWLPVVGMVAIAFIPREKEELIRITAAVTTGIQFLFTLFLWGDFDSPSAPAAAAEPKKNPYADMINKHGKDAVKEELEKLLPKNENGSRVVLNMTDYAEDILTHWKNITGKVDLKTASTPFVPDGTLLADDWEEKGQLCAQSCSMCMKILWFARLCRPDVQKPCCDLASRVSKWSVNDDKRLERLVNYISTTKDFQLEGYVGDPVSYTHLRAHET